MMFSFKKALNFKTISFDDPAHIRKNIGFWTKSSQQLLVETTKGMPSITTEYQGHCAFR